MVVKSLFSFKNRSGGVMVNWAEIQTPVLQIQITLETED